MLNFKQILNLCYPCWEQCSIALSIISFLFIVFCCGYTMHLQFYVVMHSSIERDNLKQVRI